MLKVVIADDEYYILKGIEKIIREYLPEYEVAGSAVKGQEALEMISISKADLLVVDINMPEMDGFELIKLAKQIYPDIFIIIISGYEEFQYYRYAIKEGVSAYLLKPIQIEEFVNVMNEVAKQIAHKKSIEAAKKDMLIRMICAAHGCPDNNELEMALNENEIYINSENGYIVVIFSIDKNSDFNYQKQITLLNHSIIKIAQEVFDGNKNIFLDNIQEFIGLISCNSCIQVEDKCSHFINKVKTELGISLSAGIGTTAYKADELSLSYNNASTALEYKFYSGNMSINSFLNIQNPHLPVPIDFSKEIQIIEESINKLDSVKLEETIEAIFSRLISIKPFPAESKKIILMLILAIEKGIIKVFPNQQNVLKKIQEFNIDKYELIIDVKEHILKTIKSIFTEIFNQISNSNASVAVRIALEYINENLCKDISLGKVSSHVYMHPAYFSKIFKDETGLSFSEYINEAKMEKAKYLLRETMLKIKDISVMLGYSNEKHFYKMFKKNVKMTPNQYRSISN